jgi:hypothetical protein
MRAVVLLWIEGRGWMVLVHVGMYVSTNLLRLLLRCGLFSGKGVSNATKSRPAVEMLVLESSVVFAPGICISRPEAL